MAIHAEHLADAYELVAQANHYLIGIVARDDIALDDYNAAEQILITRQNGLRPGYAGTATRHKRLDLALDVLAYDRRRRFAL